MHVMAVPAGGGTAATATAAATAAAPSAPAAAVAAGPSSAPPTAGELEGADPEEGCWHMYSGEAILGQVAGAGCGDNDVAMLADLFNSLHSGEGHACMVSGDGMVPSSGESRAKSGHDAMEESGSFHDLFKFMRA